MTTISRDNIVSLIDELYEEIERQKDVIDSMRETIQNQKLVIDDREKTIKQQENVIKMMKSHISSLVKECDKYDEKKKEEEKYEKHKQIIREKMKDIEAFTKEMAQNLYSSISLDYCKWFLECFLDEEKKDKDFDKLKEVFKKSYYHIYKGRVHRSLLESMAYSIEYLNEDAYNKYLKTHTKEELMNLEF